jgi:hypothetical protein
MTPFRPGRLPRAFSWADIVSRDIEPAAAAGNEYVVDAATTFILAANAADALAH